MNLEKVVEKVVESFIDKRWPFTALDISNGVKKEDGAEAVRHRDVAPVVRNIFMAGLMTNSYEQDLIDVTLPNGDKRNAYLYHHWSTDCDNYTNRTQQAVAPKVANTTKVSDKLGGATITNVMAQKANVTAKDVKVTVQKDKAVAPVQATIPAPKVKRAQKDDHRLEVPVAWVGDMWNNGDTIYAIKATNGDLVLRHADDVQTNDDVVGTMIVNSDGRLRVTKKVLDKVFTSSSSGNELSVYKAQSFIIVTED